jgi:uncharacterized protein (TIGR03435 family)
MLLPLALWKRSLAVMLIFAVICIESFGPAAVAQKTDFPETTTSELRPANHHTHEFGVVSIKPGKPGETDWHYGMMRNGDGYEAVNLPLWATIELAFFPPGMIRPERMIGAPDWVFEERWDFRAKVDDSDLADWKESTKHSNEMWSNDLIGLMLESALRDRCKLVAHLVPAQISGYALVIRRNGPNHNVLKSAPPEEALPEHALIINRTEDARMVPYVRSDEEPTVRYIRTSMAVFAHYLAEMYRVPVENKTGLTGRFDFNLRKVNEFGDVGTDWDFGALGLKIVRVNVPAQTLMIDHIERPSQD